MYNPLYGICSPEVSTTYSVAFDEITGEAYPLATSKIFVPDDTFIASLVMNAIYSAGFFFGGFFIFKKRDIK